MNYKIQPNISCENCIVCGSRPEINQTNKNFSIVCPNDSCKNVVGGGFINFDLWNKLNRRDVSVTPVRYQYRQPA
jgi:hypothetical protein